MVSRREQASKSTYLLPSEVAEVLQVSPKTVTRWAKEGKLASRRTLGGHRRYARADIESLAERLQEALAETSPIEKPSSEAGRAGPVVMLPSSIAPCASP